MTISPAPAARAPSTAALTSPVSSRWESVKRRCPGNNCSLASLTPPTPSTSVTMRILGSWARQPDASARRPARIRFIDSEQQLRAHLKLPPPDHAEHSANLGRHADVGSRSRQIRMVRRVEGFAAKLESDFLGNLQVLEQR